MTAFLLAVWLGSCCNCPRMAAMSAIPEHVKALYTNTAASPKTHIWLVPISRTRTFVRVVRCSPAQPCIVSLPLAAREYERVHHVSVQTYFDVGQPPVKLPRHAERIL